MTSRKPFKCSECGKSFSKTNLLLAHLQGHLLGKNMAVLCDICSKSFDTVRALRIHNTEKHTMTRKSQEDNEHILEVSCSYKCGLCKQPFSSPASLLEHVNKNLVGADVHCEICYKRFSHCLKLKRHCAKHIPSSFVRKISMQRDEELSRSKNSEIYKREKAKIYPSFFKCSLCPRQYSRTDSLKKHVFNCHVKHVERLVCTVCKEEFTTEEGLRRHVWTHVDSETQKACAPFKKRACFDESSVVTDAFFSEKMVTNSDQCKDHIGYISSNDLKLFVKYEPSADRLVTENSDKNTAFFQCDLGMQYENLKKNHNILEEMSSKFGQCQCGDTLKLVPAVGDDATFVCSTCPRKFVEKAFLSNHFGKNVQKVCRENIQRAISEEVGTPALEILSVHKKPTTKEPDSSNFNNIPDNVSSSNVCKHSGKQRNIYRCKVCCRNFSSEESLNYHYSKKKEYHCDPCEKKFCYESEFNRHINSKLHCIRRKISKEQKIEQCKFCSRSFPKKSSLARHVTRKHKNNQGHLRVNSKIPPVSSNLSQICERPHSCQTCGRSFKVRAGLTHHMKVHTAIASSKASCKKKRDSVQTNIIQSCKPKVCGLCDEQFKDSTLLSIHLRCHHKIISRAKRLILPCDKGRPFACTFCPWKFMHKAHLKEHLFIHTGCPYKCSLCPKAFRRVSHLMRHMKTIHRSNSISSL